MKSKFNYTPYKRLPIINQPNRRTHHNFFSVCIKAIEDNKEGVINKSECIKNILKLKEQKTKLLNRKLFHKTNYFNFYSQRNLYKFKTTKVINKRRTLSQILHETQQLEKAKSQTQMQGKEKDDLNMEKTNEINNNENNLNYNNKINDKGEMINKKEDEKEKENLRANNNTRTNTFMMRNQNINRKRTLSLSNNNVKHFNNNSNIRKENKEKSIKKKEKKNVPRRVSLLKSINEYLESNDVALFELLSHNPFQNKPYQISKGYEFLEAVKFQNYDYVREALAKSNDFLFVIDYYGQTCYHWAAKLGNVKMLQLLIDNGKHLNQKDFKGRTPLYIAAYNNNKEICDLLLRNRGNIHLKDKNGLSPADVAGSKELKYYLQDYLTSPFTNVMYRKKILDFLTVRDKKYEKNQSKLKNKKDGNNDEDKKEKKEGSTNNKNETTTNNGDDEINSNKTGNNNADNEKGKGKEKGNK